MSKKSRIFSDIDLNFATFPLSSERNTAFGTITANQSSDEISGVNTLFSDEWINRNIYVGSSLVGKVKSIVSSTKVILYSKSLINVNNSSFTWSIPTDITKRIDDNAIKASIRNLILTKNFERPFHSEIGSPLSGLLFEPVSPVLAQLISKVIEQTITNFEPRVAVLQVSTKFSADNNSVYCSITYRIVNTTTPQTVNLTLKRTR